MNTEKQRERGPDAEQHLSPTERALVSAVGKALAILSAALQGRPAFQTDRFADMLALFSTVAREEDALEGLFLACWADIVKESGDQSGSARPSDGVPA